MDRPVAGFAGPPGQILLIEAWVTPLRVNHLLCSIRPAI